MSDTSHLRKPSTETAKMAEALGDLRHQGRPHAAARARAPQTHGNQGIQYLRDIAAFAKGRGQ